MAGGEAQVHTAAPQALLAYSVRFPRPPWNLRTVLSRYSAPAFAVAASVAFLIVRPAAGDLWAAEARASAAVHGVGLTYWFSWFGGTIPGHYSVIAPFLTRLVDAGLLAAICTVAITPLCQVLLRGSAHPLLGTWFAAVGSSFSLWSGRVPFAFGSVLMLTALLFVRADRRRWAAAAGVLAALASPVSGAFLILGLVGLFLHDIRLRSAAASAAGGAGVCLLALAIYYGMPGPEGFQWPSVLVSCVAIVLMLYARPPAYLRAVLWISLFACPLLALIPNGMGSNFERFAWICLPVATVATSAKRARVAAACAGVALVSCVIGTVQDLRVAAEPMSDTAYYSGLIGQLDRMGPALRNYRLEVVPDGTHVAAYALLDHAQLARGYETQSDNALNSVLIKPGLDAVSFKVWLDNNAVGYVAIDRATLRANPEDELIRSGSLPYLHRLWSDSKWQLYAVASPTPIVAPPARVSAVSQANLVVSVPRPGDYPLRLHWSHLLSVAGPAQSGTLVPDGQGWTTLQAPVAGRYELSG